MTIRPEPGIYFPGEMPDPGRAALFLDRDGVINVNHGYVHTPECTQWVPGIFELCKAARDAGYVLVVVTNQAGIARGYYSERKFLDYTRWMHGKFASEGVPLLATLYCPHHPTAGMGELAVECTCRKPAPGMFEAAGRLLGLAMERSLMVGDQASDLAAAEGGGVPYRFLIQGDAADPFGGVQAWIAGQSTGGN